MELRRTRLCPWKPVGIDALAFSPSGTLAVGRETGAMDAWQILADGRMGCFSLVEGEGEHRRMYIYIYIIIYIHIYIYYKYTYMYTRYTYTHTHIYI